MRKTSGVGFKKAKKEGLTNSSSSGALGGLKFHKTPSNALATSTSGTSLGFHAGKVNQTIYSGRDNLDDSSSQVEEHKFSGTYTCRGDQDTSWTTELIDHAHQQPI